MVEEELTALYAKTKRQLAQLVEDMTFSNFYRALQSGKRSYSLKNTEIVKTIDEEWVRAISEAVPHIDAIVNNPRKYMKRETEVVPVEKAKVVDSESVRHLASHTNLISSVNNGMVRPNKILTAFNDESLELYENRFVVTLILKVSQFIDRRYFLLGAGGNEFSSSMNVEGEFEQAGEETDYGIRMTVHQGAQYFEGGVSESVYADLFMIRKYVTSFKYSPFMKAMGSCAPVRPPIMKTNLLVKEPNYAACLKLWDFISNYDKAGYKIEVNETAPQLTREEIDELDLLQVLEYLALKNFMSDFDDRRRPMKKCEKKTVKPTMDEYETSRDKRSEQGLSAGEFSIRDAIDGSAKHDVDEAVKNAVIHALRKEQVKQEMREREEREREDMLSAVVREALEYNKNEEKEAERRQERAAMAAIRDALKAEDSRLREQKRQEDKRARAVEKALSRQIEAFKADERAEKENRKREERERDRLMGAILSDMLKIEEDRRYVEENPVVMFGHERMPVPVGDGSRLPASKEVADFYYDMFTPPPTLTDEDWAELEALKAKNRRPRRRVKEDAVYAAIRRAMRLARAEERAEKELEERLRREQTQAEAAAVLDNLDNGAGANFAEDGLPAEARDALRGGSGVSPSEKTDAENGTNGAETSENTLAPSGAVPHVPKDSGEGDADGKENDGANARGTSGGGQQEPYEESARNRALQPIPEEKEGFWRRLIRILFFWWRKK